MKKKRLQYEVARNGREAVDKWGCNAYNLIIVSFLLQTLITHDKMDLIMPVMNGIDATKEIRRLEREQQRKSPSLGSRECKPAIIVALTASSLDSDREMAMDAGCNDFMLKPVHWGLFERKLVEWGCFHALSNS